MIIAIYSLIFLGLSFYFKFSIGISFLIIYDLFLEYLYQSPLTHFHFFLANIPEMRGSGCMQGPLLPDMPF